MLHLSETNQYNSSSLAVGFREFMDLLRYIYRKIITNTTGLFPFWISQTSQVAEDFCSPTILQQAAQEHPYFCANLRIVWEGGRNFPKTTRTIFGWLPTYGNLIAESYEAEASKLSRY